MYPKGSSQPVEVIDAQIKCLEKAGWTKKKQEAVKPAPVVKPAVKPAVKPTAVTKPAAAKPAPAKRPTATTQTAASK